MPSALRPNPERWFRAAAAILAATICLGACVQLNDPFRDAAAYSRPEMTTPSAEVYLAAERQSPPMAIRGWHASDVFHENGTVTHWPLWFEDPFEVKGNDLTDALDRDAPDNRFAWNAADYLHVGYGPGRFLLNLGALPVSAVAQHPGRLMASDGRLSKGLFFYDHDTRYSRPTDEPPDYNDLSRTRVRYVEHAGTEHPELTEPPESPRDTSPTRERGRKGR